MYSMLWKVTMRRHRTNNPGKECVPTVWGLCLMRCTLVSRQNKEMFLISATSPLTPTSALKRCRHISWESKLFTGRGRHTVVFSGNARIITDAPERDIAFWRTGSEMFLMKGRGQVNRWTARRTPFGRARSVWCRDLAAMGTGSLFFSPIPPQQKHPRHRAAGLVPVRSLLAGRGHSVQLQGDGTHTDKHTHRHTQNSEVKIKSKQQVWWWWIHSLKWLTLFTGKRETLTCRDWQNKKAMLTGWTREGICCEKIKKTTTKRWRRRQKEKEEEEEEEDRTEDILFWHTWEIW